VHNSLTISVLLVLLPAAAAAAVAAFFFGFNFLLLVVYGCGVCTLPEGFFRFLQQPQCSQASKWVAETYLV
jgi:hypothetical protein